MVWFFSRDADTVRYEIRRTASEDGYEVGITFPDGRTRTERARDAAELLQRCAELADALKLEGWRAP